MLLNRAGAPHLLQATLVLVIVSLDTARCCPCSLEHITQAPDTLWDVGIDTEYVVAAGWDNNGYLWGRATDIRIPLGHTDEVWGAKLLRTGGQSMAVTASLDGSVRLWASDGTELQRLHQGIPMVTALAASNFEARDQTCQSQHVAAGDKNGSLSVWQYTVDAPSLSLHGTYQADNSMITSVAFGPPRIMVATSSDGWVRVWDLEDDKPAHEWRAYTGSAVAVAVGRGKLVTSGYNKSGIQERWDLAEWSLAGELMSRAEGFDAVRALAFAPSSGELFVGTYGSYGANPKLQTLETAKSGWPVTSACAGHTGNIHALEFGRDGWLVSGAADGALHLWKCDQ